MKELVLKGKIIDSNNEPAANLQVKAFVNDHMIGQTTSSLDGTFKIEFDKSDFKEFLEIFEHRTHVYLVIEYDEGKQQLKTKLSKISKEIEYHIKLMDYVPDPDIVDIYSNNIRKTIDIINDAGIFINTTKINLDSLVQGKVPDNLIQRSQKILDHYDDIIKNYTDWQALFSGIVAVTLKQENLDTIGYDGPQVPRNSWREGNDQVIIWPREEIINWE